MLKGKKEIVKWTKEAISSNFILTIIQVVIAVCFGYSLFQYKLQIIFYVVLLQTHY